MGLDNAVGEWITFVDSDDLLVDRALCLDWSILKEDFIIFPFYFFYNNGQSDLYTLDTVGKIENLHSFYEKELGNFNFRTSWSKLFKSNLIGELRFDEKIRCGEDTLFVLNYLSKIKNCSIQESPFYIFNQDKKEFHEKYSLSVDNAIYALSTIYTAFKRLNIRCGIFEKSLFFDFKSYCQKDINKNSSSWFDNVEVKRIYFNIRRYVGIEQRLKYFILSFRLVLKIKVLLKNRLCLMFLL